MRYLLFLFVFISSTTLAQNGINYQGAATDSYGAKLVDQNISLRTSVLQGGIEGTISYSETHNITTDQFGLFNVVIGQGEVVSGIFDDITWGADAHFLKVELDATGGSDYSLVSTTQMMSVPYALHAENAGLDSAAIADMLASMNISSNNSGGCDKNYPDGLEGDFISINMLQGNYTVPNGKNLYILNAYTDNGSTVINLDGKNFFRYNDLNVYENPPNALIAGSGTTLSVYSNSSSPTHNTIFGLLVNKSVDFISIDMLQGNYTVPNGKNLYILNAYADNGSTVINLDGKNFFRYNDLNVYENPQNALLVGSGFTLSVHSNSSSPTHNTIFGYLVDEDYFENCGGGVGTTTSSVTETSEGGVLSIADLCMNVDKIVGIDFNLNGYRGLTGVVLDDFSNVYISLSNMGYNDSGGEIRKYDSNLNLLWTKIYDNYCPNQIIYQNGYLLVSGVQGAFSPPYPDMFINMLDSENGEVIWEQTINGYYNYGEHIDCNNDYVCIIVNGSGSGLYFNTYNFTTGEILIENQLNYSGYVKSITIDDENNLYVYGSNPNTGSNHIKYFDITSASTSSTSLNISIGSNGDLDFHNNSLITISYGNDYFNINNFQIINQGASGYGSYSKDKIKSFGDGYSCLFSFSDNVNILGQYYLTHLSDSYSYAILKFDDELTIKKITSLANISNIEFGVSSSGKTAVGLKIEDGDLCINGENYSGFMLMIY